MLFTHCSFHDLHPSICHREQMLAELLDPKGTTLEKWVLEKCQAFSFILKRQGVEKEKSV